MLEQTLGHVSHGRNLRRTLMSSTDANVVCRELPYEPAGVLDRLPPRSNWTVRSSLAARSAMRAMETDHGLDALFVHTHVPAALLGSGMARVPTVVSIDATPRQIDELGVSYNHQVSHGVVEAAKRRVHSSCFRRAASLVSWSRWAADSLVADYDVPRERIEVIPPGALRSLWHRGEPRTSTDDVVRILFVGGDFERKGGQLLLDAFQRLRHDPAVVDANLELELHLVTTADVPGAPGVTVHRGLTPNSPELIALFHLADVFALPTKGDCTPLVLAEAASAGLPTVATAVGAIGESVIDGRTGHLVEFDVASLVSALRRLVVDRDHRLELGHNAERHAAATMDSEKNASRLLDILVAHATGRPRHRTMLTVSGRVQHDVHEAIDAGLRPLADYVAISEATGASMLDWNRLHAEGSLTTEIIRRFAGNSVAMAYHLFRLRSEYDAVITDGEQVGLPLAALLRLGGPRSIRHVMIGHRLSPLKKQLPTRLLGVAGNVDDVVVYSAAQMRAAQSLFKGENHEVHHLDFMVDTEFFSPTRSLDGRSGSRPKLCAAGREFRDYPTLIEAVRDLDVDLVIASASPWSRRSDNAHQVVLPANVSVTALTQRELRRLLDESDALVMPLQPCDFQAGVTTILEAFSMERPVICTATEGQTDVVVDGFNGWYVPPGDVDAMRRAIVELTSDPERAAVMGKRGRRLVEERADVRAYADRFGRMVDAPLRLVPPPTRLGPRPEVGQLRSSG
ncbi:MAG: glycosyltransferase family 4 protein [Actinomycetota bacterium]